MSVHRASAIGNRASGIASRLPDSRRPRATHQTLRITIRPATTADVEAVTELRLALFAAEWRRATVKASPEIIRRARAVSAAQLASTQQLTLLALHRGQAIGILRCTARKRAGLAYPARVATIATVYVRRAWRRRGVLRALLRAADRWARARGLTEMQLLCAADNAVGRAAWRALGFEPIEILHRRTIPRR
ncbi:MAG TPA: GNAT family N-acetyltransferase [Gemmatimonadaceae bacterium]